MLASNIKQIFIAIGLVLIASLIYVFGTSMIFFSSGNHLELSYLLAIICFMPLGFIVIPHLIAQKHTKISSEEISDGREYSLLFLYDKVEVSC